MYQKNGEQKTFLPHSEIEPQFLGISSGSVVNIPSTLFLKIGFIALRCTNVYTKFFIKTVPDTSLHKTSDLT